VTHQAESSKTSKNSPVRTCIATGEEMPKTEMIRFVVSPDNLLVVDVEEKLPGRGIWVSATPNAIRHACDKRLFAKAARQQVTVPADLETFVEARLLARVQNWISLSVKSGNIVTGFVKVEAYLKADKAKLILEASDGSRDGREKIIRMAQHVPYISILTRAELGFGLGKEDAVHLALGFGGITEHLQRDLRRLAGFREVISL
jgi:predicted RNA-binding protein YlxR (DUF448 family)/ribosomal protein L30E